VVTLIAVANGIRVQAEDLAKSRAFMAKQSESMAQQSATITQQAFDSVFFNLLDRFSHVQDRVRVTRFVRLETVGESFEEVTPTGKAAFEDFYSVFSNRYRAQKDVADRLRFLQGRFAEHYQSEEAELGQYFRTLYQVLKWIDRGKITDGQKAAYAKMARAQLSELELCVIFYNGLTQLSEK
jgi:hypothetical protein